MAIKDDLVMLLLLLIGHLPLLNYVVVASDTPPPSHPLTHTAPPSPPPSSAPPSLLLLLPLLHLCSQEDFFRDLEKEVDDWSKKRSTTGKPASLWEELAAIGEEFVDFLEQGLKDDGSSGSSSSSGGCGKEGSSTGGSSSFNRSGKSKSPVDAYEDLKKQYDLGGNGR